MVYVPLRYEWEEEAVKERAVNSRGWSLLVFFSYDSPGKGSSICKF